MGHPPAMVNLVLVPGAPNSPDTDCVVLRVSRFQDQRVVVLLLLAVKLLSHDRWVE